MSVASFIWLGNRDSNPNRQSQSLQCYLYTIPQYSVAPFGGYRMYIILIKRKKSTRFFKNCRFFSKNFSESRAVIG